jgi:hypothetical protein
MTTLDARQLLTRFRSGQTGEEEVLRAFQAAPVADLGFAHVDTHRALRKGFPEVIFGQNKTPEQIVAIAGKLHEHSQNILATRVTPEHARVFRRKFRKAVYHEAARCLTFEVKPLPKRPGLIAVLSAGTSDLPVAEEAALTADVMGNRVQRVHDLGVAGLHRLLGKLGTLQEASVLIVVAGMEGALPSVVGGYVACPVIAVPTSVGYGASFGGVAALLGMLNSCASNVTVVNIDAGFKGGYVAGLIARNAAVARKHG